MNNSEEEEENIIRGTKEYVYTSKSGQTYNIVVTEIYNPKRGTRLELTGPTKKTAVNGWGSYFEVIQNANLRSFKIRFIDGINGKKEVFLSGTFSEKVAGGKRRRRSTKKARKTRRRSKK